jgi:hypothetical protein
MYTFFRETRRAAQKKANQKFQNFKEAAYQKYQNSLASQVTNHSLNKPLVPSVNNNNNDNAYWVSSLLQNNKLYTHPNTPTQRAHKTHS